MGGTTRALEQIADRSPRVTHHQYYLPLLPAPSGMLPAALAARPAAAGRHMNYDDDDAAGARGHYVKADDVTPGDDATLIGSFMMRIHAA